MSPASFLPSFSTDRSRSLPASATNAFRIRALTATLMTVGVLALSACGKPGDGKAAAA